jgi:hypothetical protein
MMLFGDVVGFWRLVECGAAEGGLSVVEKK